MNFHRTATTRSTLALATALALCTAWGGSAQAQPSPAKKELIAKLVQLQTPGIEQLARGLVEQPASQMLREAAQVLQSRVAPEQREATAKKIQDSAKKYVDEAAPLLRDRALKLAPAVLGAAYDEKFTEDELKQLLAWLDSPLNRKYQQVTPELQNAFVQKLVADARPVVDPKLMALDQSIRNALGLPPAPPPPKPSAPKPAGSAASSAK